MTGKRNNDRINAILDSFTDEDYLSGDLSQLSTSGLKIEYLPIQLVYPDPAQPRRVLPSAIYQAFYEQRYTPAQALREFIKLVQVTARQKGRPFSNVEDLLPNPDDESDTETPKLTPEEALLRDLVTLAVTIKEDGQINPLTVVDCSEGVTRLYRIETGERRYWATWLVIEFLSGYNGDATLPCILIPDNRASVFRQAKENTSRSGLNAIAMARQAALLILAVHDIHPPNGPVSNDFYRQALELDLRAKREHAPDVLSAMGGISKVRLYQYKSLLGLSDEALELADRHSIDEGKLRFVLTLHPDHHYEVVRQIIDFDLTGKQVKEMCEQPFENKQTDDQPKISRQVKRFAEIVLNTKSEDIEEILQAMLVQETDIEVVKLRWRNYVQMVETYFDRL